MSVLILGSTPGYLFSEWLDDYDGRVVLLSGVRRSDEDWYAAFRYYKKFATTGRPELDAAELNGTYGFTRLYAHSEYDMLRAAQIRERFGIEGQTVASATAYRNKVTMKTLARKAELPTARYEALTSPLVLDEFVARHGYPVVVKPVDGAGSEGVRILRDRAAVEDFADEWPKHPHMVETFVDGDLHHADGLIVDGQLVFASVSRYLGGCGNLSFKDRGTLAGILVNRDHALRERILAFVQAIVKALPSPGILPFHAEIFVGPRGELTLCEIASRLAGNYISEAIQEWSGIDLRRVSVRLSCGLPAPITVTPRGAVGYLCLTRSAGRIIKLPTATPFDWVRKYRAYASQGDLIPAPRTCVDDLIRTIVVGQDEEEVVQRIGVLEGWLRKHIEIAPIESPTASQPAARA